MAAFGLSSRQFGLALTKLQECREMRATIGVETPLLHLGDDDILWVIAQRRRVHAKRDRTEPEDEPITRLGDSYFERMKKEMAIVREVVTIIDKRLSAEQLADLEVLFYMGRELHFCEEYESMVAEKLKEHAAAKNSGVEVLHLIEKTNLLQCTISASNILGRLSLRARLEAA